MVIKIQRPGLKALFDIDCKNIRALAVWLQNVSKICAAKCDQAKTYLHWRCDFKTGDVSGSGFCYVQSVCLTLPDMCLAHTCVSNPALIGMT